jgi:hypothetical protein
MKVAIMQPYFLPYLGYFQLVNAVDKFVFFDDVNFINKGWINRNNLLLNGKPHLFTIPLKDMSQNKKINQIETSIDDKWLKTFFKTLEHGYKKAPYYEAVCTLLQLIFTKGSPTIGELTKTSIKRVTEYVGLTTYFVDSSSGYNNEDLKGEERILDICLQEKANIYINPSGGTGLYKKEVFEAKGVDLKFIKSANITYPQFKNDFVPWLSMIDVLMFNSKEQVKHLLSQYELE